MRYLKQSWITAIKVGPFIDDTDGITPMEDLDLTYNMVQVSKNGGAFHEIDGDGYGIHDRDGFYTFNLTANDTDTPGGLRLEISGTDPYYPLETGFLPVWEDYVVLTAEAWNELHASTQTDLILAASSDCFDAIGGVQGTCNTILADIAALPSGLEAKALEFDFATYTKSVILYYTGSRPFVGNPSHWRYVYNSAGGKPLTAAEIAKCDAVVDWSIPPV